MSPRSKEAANLHFFNTRQFSDHKTASSRRNRGRTIGHASIDNRTRTGTFLAHKRTRRRRCRRQNRQPTLDTDEDVRLPSFPPRLPHLRAKRASPSDVALSLREHAIGTLHQPSHAVEGNFATSTPNRVSFVSLDSPLKCASNAINERLNYHN